MKTMRNSVKVIHMEQPKQVVPGYLKYVLSLALKQKQSAMFLATLLTVSVGARLTEPYLYKVVVDTLTAGLVAGGFVTAQVQTLVIVVVFWFMLAIVVNLTSAN